jgi:hypothetical protein
MLASVEVAPSSTGSSAAQADTSAPDANTPRSVINELEREDEVENFIEVLVDGAGLSRGRVENNSPRR